MIRFGNNASPQVGTSFRVESRAGPVTASARRHSKTRSRSTARRPRTPTEQRYLTPTSAAHLGRAGGAAKDRRRAPVRAYPRAVACERGGRVGAGTEIARLQGENATLKKELLARLAADGTFGPGRSRTPHPAPVV
jgi:hypothetical protein